MNILTLSGSTRKESTNTQLLHALASHAPASMTLTPCTVLSQLPIFNQDNEGDRTPAQVLSFCRELDRADGLIISSPEYVHALPGGLKNAIDWLVSRSEIIRKPVVLAHASHRGDDMLKTLRQVLCTVSERFSPDIFLRISLLGQSASECRQTLSEADNQARMRAFLTAFADHLLEQTPTNERTGLSRFPPVRAPRPGGVDVPGR